MIYCNPVHKSSILRSNVFKSMLSSCGLYFFHSFGRKIFSYTSSLSFKFFYFKKSSSCCCNVQNLQLLTLISHLTFFLLILWVQSISWIDIFSPIASLNTSITCWLMFRFVRFITIPYNSRQFWREYCSYLSITES